MDVVTVYIYHCIFAGLCPIPPDILQERRPMHSELFRYEDEAPSEPTSPTWRSHRVSARERARALLNMQTLFSFIPQLHGSQRRRTQRLCSLHICIHVLAARVHTFTAARGIAVIYVYARPGLARRTCWRWGQNACVRANVRLIKTRSRSIQPFRRVQPLSGVARFHTDSDSPTKKPNLTATMTATTTTTTTMATTRTNGEKAAAAVVTMLTNVLLHLLLCSCVLLQIYSCAFCSA